MMSKKMQITVFKKLRNKKEGGTFDVYITRLKRKTGSFQSMEVKCRKTCANLGVLSMPANIIIDTSQCNIAVREFVNSDGELKKAYQLWIGGWEKSKDEYKDTSMEDYL